MAEYIEYHPLKFWLDPASIAEIVAHIQTYLVNNPINSTTEIETIIHDYLIAHPELIGGVRSINGETGEVVLTANNISGGENVTIKDVLDSLQDQIDDIVASIPSDYQQLINDVSDLKSTVRQNETHIIAVESGTFNDNNGAQKIVNVKRLRNVTQIPVCDLYSITLPDGYSGWFFRLDKNGEHISAYNGWLSGTVNLASVITAGTEFVNIAIKKTASPNDDISADAATVESGISTAYTSVVECEALKSALTTNFSANGFPTNVEKFALADVASNGVTVTKTGPNKIKLNGTSTSAFNLDLDFKAYELSSTMYFNMLRSDGLTSESGSYFNAGYFKSDDTAANGNNIEAFNTWVKVDFASAAKKSRNYFHVPSGASYSNVEFELVALRQEPYNDKLQHILTKTYCKNLVGQDITKLYPVYIPAGTAFTMSTADGATLAVDNVNLIPYDINKAELGTGGWNFNPYTNKRTITYASDIYYLRWTKVIDNRPFQVEIGSEATEYQEYFPNSDVVERFNFDQPINNNVLRAQTFNASYHEGATDFASKCKSFSELLLGDEINNVTAPTDFETFLFFTDPHLTEFTGWEQRCYEYIAQIQKYYNSTPSTFCLCGGDWLGNSDLPSDACFKLGYIDGFMHNMFDNCYMLVGNHDTNYQGKKDAESSAYTTKLSVQSVVDLWYRIEKKAYYTFNGANTKFYCFDAGVENQSLSAQNNYGWLQAEWFASGLLSETAEHIAIATHILYYTGTNIQPLTDELLLIAKAYNDRDSINVNGVVYDFGNATGKVEFLIAGHLHSDAEATIYGIPCLMTTNVRSNETLGPTFDLVFVDYDNGEIKCIRVGSGSNRTISLGS